MPYRLTHDEAWADALRRVASEQAAAAVAGLRGRTADTWDEAVHDARKRCKKIRAVARLGRDVLGGAFPDINATFRDAARRLSAVRDAQVLVETVEGLADAYGDGAPADALATVRESLADHHLALRRRVVAESTAVDEVVAVLEAADVGSWPLGGADWDGLAEGLARVHRRGRKRMPSVQGSPEAWHDWRKRVKYLWYHLRLLQQAWQPVLGAWAAELDVLSDMTGDEHDLTVLQETLRGEVVTVDAGAAEVVLGLAAQRRHRLREVALPLGARIYAEPTGAFVDRIGAYVAAWRTV